MPNSRSLGSSARVRMDRPDRLNPARTDKDVLRIVALIVEARKLWELALDGGAWQGRTETGGRGSGFHDSDPTHSAATRPTQKQLRGSARYAASLIADARLNLEDAVRVLQNGLLRTDPEVLDEFLEKRRAATQ